MSTLAHAIDKYGAPPAIRKATARLLFIPCLAGIAPCSPRAAPLLGEGSALPQVGAQERRAELPHGGT